MDVTQMIFEMIEGPLQETGAEMYARIYESLSVLCTGEHAAIGDPPQLEDGILRASLAYDVSTISETSMQLMFGAGPANAPEGGYDYSGDLEVGGGMMKGPRPYILNRAEEAADLFIEKFNAQ